VAENSVTRVRVGVKDLSSPPLWNSTHLTCICDENFLVTDQQLVMPSTEPDVEPLDGRLTRLRQQVETAEASLRRLKLQVQETENQVEVKRQTQQAQISNASLSEQTKRASDSLRKSPRDEITLVNTAGCDSPSPRWPLTAAEYQRYGRQMIMPEVGLEGQLRLRKAKVLIVGVGGLGCPAAVYLAGAGVGTLGLMDGDTVELSNLHRQVAHATTRVGMSKVESAFQYLQSYVTTIRPSVTSILTAFVVSMPK